MQYRFSGTTRRGTGNSGVTTMPPADLPAWVQDRFRAGVRRLVVCAGPGPVPPGRDEDTVAEIAPDPGTGRRTWWAETGEA
jgi:hypothetical protein